MASATAFLLVTGILLIPRARLMTRYSAGGVTRRKSPHVSQNPIRGKNTRVDFLPLTALCERLEST
ncbi:hypothetical protein K239x_56390 [Planctomycetes bacterium K23_9]|uniref:Uncharacterized protein n=1 Tax=Stieleria marina TaxID=1930275 RepID=A0A517P2L3_9BACT|nr:hypothetical protein K239x_56390 [Planctomycetes bacterium K23_9]